jgi:hypothetical protein
LEEKQLQKNIVLVKVFDNPDTALTRRRHLFKIALSVKQIENIY